MGNITDWIDSGFEEVKDLAGLYAEVELSKNQVEMLDARAQIAALEYQRSLPEYQSQALPDALASGISPDLNTSGGKLIAVALVAVSVYLVAKAAK